MISINSHHNGLRARGELHTTCQAGKPRHKDIAQIVAEPMKRDRIAGRCARTGRLTGRDSYGAKGSRGPLCQDGQADWPLAASAGIALQAAAPRRAG